MATRDFKAYARKFLDWYYTAHPVRATELGVHVGDGQLPDLSRAGVQHQINALLGWLRKQEDLEPGMLDMPDQVDFRIIEYAIRAELLDLEEIRVWEHQPGFYVDVASRGITALLEGDSASRGTRMRSAAARLSSVPDMLAAARENLSAVPAPWARASAREARSTAGYLRSRVSTAFHADDAGPLLAGQFDGALDRAAAALDAYADWLDSSVLPRATGDYHLGRYIFLRDIQYRAHVQLSADELDQLSTNVMNDLRTQLQKVATEIDPGRTPREILDSLKADTSRVGDPVTAAQADLDAALDFVTSRHLVPLPAADLPIVRAMPADVPPPLAGLHMPGALDTTGLPAYLDVSPDLNGAALRLFVMRTTMPGAFVQRQYADAAVSEVRRVFQPRSLRDGWADYAEQLMVDEGFATADPGLRLMELQRALERQAMWHAAVRVHAFDASIDEAADSLAEMAHIDADSARRDVTRATYEPAYFSGALGRPQLIELRRAYRSYLDANDDTKGTFSLATFHEKFLKLGLPAPLARLLLMPRRREATANSRQPPH